MKDECLICGAPLMYLENDTEMEFDKIICTHSTQNNQCIGVRCPFK